MSSGRDIDLTTDARPDRDQAAAQGLGRRGVDPGRALRHHRLPQGRLGLRDHHPPGRGLRPRLPQARRRVLRRGRGRPLPPRLHRQRHGPRPPRARADRSLRRGRRPRRRPPAHAAVARGVVLRRPAAHAAGRPLHRRLRPRARRPSWSRPSRRWPTGSTSSRPSASATSSTSSSWSTTRAPACGSWSTPASSTSSCPSCAAMRLEQDPIHRHKDVLTHTIAVVAKTRPERLVRLCGALPRHRQAQDPSIGDGGVSFHHHEVVGRPHDPRAHEGAASTPPTTSRP